MMLFLTALQQMLLFAPLCFGIYLTYRVMRITDLTVEGSFVFGAAIFARLMQSHYHQSEAVILAILGGGVIGLLVALMQKYGKLDSLITSILAVFMLYSVNFEVMGQPNINLLSVSTLLQRYQAGSSVQLISVLLFVALLLVVLFSLLMRSQLGLHLRVFGENCALLGVLAKSRLLVLVFGLVVSNGLAALSGVMTAQVNGYADINMGVGVALTAIGSMVVGLTLLRQYQFKTARYHFLMEIGASLLGVLLYFLILNVLLHFGLNPILMKLVLGLLLFFFLSAGGLNAREVKYV